MNTRDFFNKGLFGHRRIAANEPHFLRLAAVPPQVLECIVQAEQRRAIAAWEDEGGTVRRHELRF